MFLKISQTLFNKVTNLQPCNFIKKRLRQWGFPAKFAKILSTPFLKEHLQWLFLFLNESITFINSFSNIFNYSLDFKKEFGSKNFSWYFVITQGNTSDDTSQILWRFLAFGKYNNIIRVVTRLHIFRRYCTTWST